MTFTTFDATQFNQNPFGPANILDNGGFEVWQRGTSFTNPTNGTYTVDRWQVYKPAVTPATANIVQVSSPVDSGQYATDINITATGTSAYQYIFQPIENYQAYQGKTLTVSVRVNTTLSNVVVSVQDSGGQFNSAAHPGDGAYHTLTVTRTVNNSTTFLDVLVGCTNITGTGHIYIDSAMLVVGSNPVAFQPVHPAIDLMRCQRYYETHGDTSGIGVIWRNTTLNQYVSHPMSFLVSKRISPTLTFTKGVFTLCVTPTSVFGNNGVNDASNWGVQAVTTPGTNEWSIYIVRNADQSTWNALQWDLSAWTASADI